MSHIVQVKVKISDLRALAAAAKELGGELVLDQKTHTFYSGKGQCEHAIKIPGVNYEVGVVKLEGGGYTLAHDPYGGDQAGYGSHDGHKLTQKFGDGLKKLTQYYAVAKAEIEARAKGWMTSRQTLKNGSIKITMTGVA